MKELRRMEDIQYAFSKGKKNCGVLTFLAWVLPDTLPITTLGKGLGTNAYLAAINAEFLQERHLQCSI